MIVAALCLILTCNGVVAQPREGGSSLSALQIPASLFEKAVACIKAHDYDK